MFIKIFRKTLSRACYGYTVLSFLYLLVMLSLYRSYANPYPGRVMMLLPFAFFVALAHTLVADTKIKTSWKLLIHFLILTSDLLLFIWLPFKSTLSGSTVLILFVIYLLLYAIGAFVAFRYLAAQKKNKEANSDYKSVYSDKQGK